MWNSLSKSLHYSGIIVIEKGGTKAIEYVPKEMFSEKFSLRGIFKGIEISYPKPQKPPETTISSGVNL